MVFELKKLDLNTIDFSSFGAPHLLVQGCYPTKLTPLDHIFWIERNYHINDARILAREYQKWLDSKAWKKHIKPYNPALPKHLFGAYIKHRNSFMEFANSYCNALEVEFWFNLAGFTFAESLKLTAFCQEKYEQGKGTSYGTLEIDKTYPFILCDFHEIQENQTRHEISNLLNQNVLDPTKETHLPWYYRYQFITEQLPPPEILREVNLLKDLPTKYDSWLSSLELDKKRNLSKVVINNERGNGIISLPLVIDFLNWLLKQWELTIGNYFLQMQPGKSFFLIAATGLGKTVGTPILLLVQALLEVVEDYQDQELEEVINLTQLESPTIWVVVPTIAIVQEAHSGLNCMFEEYLALAGSSKQCVKANPLYGARSSSYSRDYGAPIQFITTGVLPLLASSGELRPGLDIVLKDESHKTLTIDEAMELALSELWKQGIVVNFMSATVGTRLLEQRLRTTIIEASEERFPKYWHLSKKSLIDTTLEAIEEFHIYHNAASPFFPPMFHPFNRKILEGVDAQGKRASGILVVVDSFNGNASDAVKLRQAIEPLCNQHGIEVLGFASSVRDDDKRNRSYQKQLQKVLDNNGKYVIIATNVIEMGVTWATLDMVITGDTEITNIMVEGVQVPIKLPISIAALLQRGGRVGRKRPGLVTIAGTTSEITKLSDKELNAKGLTPQEIVFPLQKFKPLKLAHKLHSLGVVEPEMIRAYLDTYQFPSLVNDEDIGYMVSMLTSTQKLYQALEVHNPENMEMTKYFKRYIGDPIYPWLVAAGVAMLGSRTEKTSEMDGYHYKKSWTRSYDRFLFLVLMGYWAQIPTDRVVNKHTTPNGKAVDRSSDLLLTTCLVTAPHGLEGKHYDTFLEILNRGIKEDEEGVENNSFLRRPFKPKQDLKFAKYFKELLDNMKKAGWRGEEQFYQYFIDGFANFPDNYSLGTLNEFSEYQSDVCLLDRNVNEPIVKHLVRKLLTQLGTPFTISPVSSSEHEVTLRYQHNGRLVEELADTRLHLVIIDYSKSYTGILMPGTDRDQKNVELSMQHWSILENIV